MIKKIAFIWFSVIASLQAQYSEQYKSLKIKYPDVHSVYLDKSLIIDIGFSNNDELEIKEYASEERLYLSKLANRNAKQEINYSSFSTISDLKAASFKFDKKKYIKKTVSDFIESDAQSSSFYDDTKRISYLYENLEEGAKTQQSYCRTIQNPRFISSHIFGDFVPILNNKLVVIVDNNIEVEFKKIGFENSEDLNYSVKKSKNKTTHTWIRKNANKLELEFDAPKLRKRIPTIVPIITSYNLDGKTQQIAGDVGDLYQWYYSLIKGVNKEEPTSDFKELVQGLIADANSEIEKVKAIYYWVQENIKYIAFEYALGGFIPREATNVFEKKYGDCKDNSSILQQMFKIAGLKGYLTWIGTRSIPFTYKELPTPSVDNHMIFTYISSNNTPYFLDATGRYLPLEMPSSFIQGKEALVGISKEEYKILKVPFVEAEKNIYKDSVSIKIDNKSIKGVGKMILDGYPKVDFFNSLEYIKTDKDKKEFYKNVLEKGSNKCLVDAVEELNKYSYEKPFIINYNFDVEDYVKSYNDEIYINMNLFSGIDNFKTSDNRKSGKDYRYNSDTSLKAVLTIPENTIIDYLPEDYTIDQNNFRCSIIYTKIAPSTIEMTYSITQKFTSLDLNEQKQLNKLVSEIKKRQKDVVVLKKI